MEPGTQIKQLRTEKGYSKQAVALHAGVSANTVAQAERSGDGFNCIISLETITRILHIVEELPPLQENGNGQAVDPELLALGREIARIRSGKNYTLAAAGRILGKSPATIRAAELGGRYHATCASRETIEAILAAMRDLPRKPKLSRVRRPPKKSTNVPTRKYDNARNCKGEECGIVIFDTVAEVPRGWVTHFHINVNGYCPSCARRYGFSDLVRQKAEEIRRGGAEQ